MAKRRTKAQIAADKAAATNPVEQFSEQVSELSAMTPDEIRYIPDEPDVFDEVLQAKAQQVTQPEHPQQSDAPHQEHRRFNGRGLIGFHTPERGTVRVVDESGHVGIQMDERPSDEELKILRESRGEERGLSWNSVRGMNFKPTNGNPIGNRLDVEQRAREIAENRGWVSAVDQSRSDEGPSR